jgi:hypothetical protein
VDANQHVEQLFYNSAVNQWLYNDLTATASALPASPGSALTSFILSDGPHIAYVDANQHVEQLFYNRSFLRF